METGVEWGINFGVKKNMEKNITTSNSQEAAIRAEATLTNMKLLQRARACWEAMGAFRQERERCKRFTYGDQWGDPVLTPEGTIREEDLIRRQGNMPLKNNLIRRLVRNVLGVFRNQWEIPTCEPRDAAERPQAEAMQQLLNYNIDLNRMEELYARTMEEFLISGMAVHRKWYGTRMGRSDCWTDFVSPDSFFMNCLSGDFRNWDADLVGQLHDMSFASVCASFARTPADYTFLRQLHISGALGETYTARNSINEFLVPVSPGLCRVIEIWERQHIPRLICHDPLAGECWKAEPEEAEKIEAINRRRRKKHPEGNAFEITTTWTMEEEWQYRFLTPRGIELSSGKSPYRHGRHPYVMKAYPYIDGEIHSFVSDIIDQQKYTNRLISMYDWLLRSSAKGVLMIPEGSLPEGIGPGDMAEEWSKFNGVILYRHKPGTPVPQQVTGTADSSGLAELLNIQMKMMEDVSGVNGALQGKLANASMSGTLYDQQTRNAITALTDLLKSYRDFVIDATTIDASNLRQFYTPERIQGIIGGNGGLLHDQPGFFDTSWDFRFS